MANFFARTKLAMEIAGLDAQKFNQAVNDGHYECAPHTTRGATRIFDLNDLIALTVFRRQLEAGLTAKAAGQIACGLRNFLNYKPEADRALCVVPSIGSHEWHDPESFDRDDTHMPDKHGPRRDIWEMREFRIKYIRERVLHQLDEAARILGDE